MFNFSGNKKDDSAQPPKTVVPVVPITNSQPTSQTTVQPVVNNPAPVSTKSSGGSSPWDEELDLPEEVDRKNPTIIGSLDPDGQASGIFNVPANIEEKVGKKIPAVEAINKSTIQTSPLPSSSASSSAPISSSVSDSIPVSVPTPAPAPTPNPAIPSNPTTPIAQSASIKTTTPLPSSSKPEVSNPIIKDVTKKTEIEDAPADDFDWFGDYTPTAPSSPIGPASIPPKQIDIAKPQVQSQTQVPAESISTPTVPINSDIKPPIAPEPTPVKSDFSFPIPISNTPKLENIPAVEPVSQAEPAVTPPIEPISDKKITKYLHVFNIKMIAAFLGVLLVIFVGLIGLTEFGVLNLGLEKVYGAVGIEQLWGGLSKNPETALMRSFSTMKDHPNFKVQGSIDLTVDGGIASEITSPLISQDVIKESNIQTVSSNIKFKTNGESSYADVSVTSDLGQNNISIQNSSVKLYVLGNDKINFSNNTDPTKWVSYTLRGLKDKNIQNDLFKIDTTSGVSVQGSRLASEKVDGENCFHYKIDSLEPGNALSNFGITSDMVQSVSGEVWLGVKSKLIKKIVLKITTPTSSSVALINLDLTFYDYDVANEIAAIDNAKLATTAEKVLVGDEKRKDDVNKILVALNKYKDANGVFPNSSNQLIPLNSSDNIVKSALIPAYLTVFPSDEKASSGWYYAYKSDGLKCSVSARLENTSDTTGQLVNNVLLYIKYNSD